VLPEAAEEISDERGKADLPYMPFDPFVLAPLGWTDDVLDHRRLAGTEAKKVRPSLPEGQPVVWAGLDIQSIEILTVVLPKTDRADEVITALRQRDVVAAGTWMAWGSVPRGIPDGWVFAHGNILSVGLCSPPPP
jgi:hypothetical protein